MMKQLTEAEYEEMNRFVFVAAQRRSRDEAAEALEYLTRASEWLIGWRARRQGGGVG
jgi:hypothetical protein